MSNATEAQHGQKGKTADQIMELFFNIQDPDLQNRIIEGLAEKLKETRDHNLKVAHEELDRVSAIYRSTPEVRFPQMVEEAPTAKTPLLAKTRY